MGNANSIGTNTACVGTVNPAPMSKRTCPTAATPRTYSATSDSDSDALTPVPASATSATAAIRKPPPTHSSARSSAGAMRRARSAKDSRTRSDSMYAWVDI
jgi:hypothetical protein